jgi:hypothetical protein
MELSLRVVRHRSMDPRKGRIDTVFAASRAA